SEMRNFICFELLGASCHSPSLEVEIVGILGIGPLDSKGIIYRQGKNINNSVLVADFQKQKPIPVFANVSDPHTQGMLDVQNVIIQIVENFLDGVVFTFNPQNEVIFISRG